jgi:hypothetical protein
MVRAYELRIETETAEAIQELLKPIRNPKSAVVGAVEYLEYFLAFHLCFNHVDIKVLAAMAIHMSLTQRGHAFNESVLLRKLGVTAPPDFEEMYNLALATRYGWAGHHIPNEFFEPETQSRNNFVHPAMPLAKDMAFRKWILYGSSEPTFKAILWSDRRRTIAACLGCAFQRHLCGFEHIKILKRLRLQSLFHDHVIRGTVKQFMEGATAGGIDWDNKDVLKAVTKREETN